MEKEIITKVLELLGKLYDEKPTTGFTTSHIAKMLEINDNEVQGVLIYLQDKGLIKSFQNFYGRWVQKISAKGLDELEKIKSGKDSTQTSVSDTEPLELEVERNDSQGNLNIFISHKFVKADQKLAIHLEKLLKDNNLYGYIFERKKEYEMPLSEKIKNRIDNSHYLVAILTKNSLTSPSVNQEIGYAIGTNTPVLIMAEKGEIPGVLVQGYEHEEFTRENFSSACINIVNYIIDHEKPEKISKEEKKLLLENVYIPSYNSMKNILENQDYVIHAPENPWMDFAHFYKLKIEKDIRILFEKYTLEHKKWQEMTSTFRRMIHSNSKQISEIILNAFSKAKLSTSDNHILVPGGGYIETMSFIDSFDLVLFNFDENNPERYYNKLLGYSKISKNGHDKIIQYAWKQNTGLFFNLLESMSEISSILKSSITIEHLDNQREKLKKSIEDLTEGLEKKL